MSNLSSWSFSCLCVCSSSWFALICSHPIQAGVKKWQIFTVRVDTTVLVTRGDLERALLFTIREELITQSEAMDKEILSAVWSICHRTRSKALPIELTFSDPRTKNVRLWKWRISSTLKPKTMHNRHSKVCDHCQAARQETDSSIDLSCDFFLGFNYDFIQISSKMTFYRNGENQGTAFNDFSTGIYYPTASFFKNVVIKFNFGPNFKHPPRDVTFRGVRDCFDVRIFVSKSIWLFTHFFLICRCTNAQTNRQ